MPTLTIHIADATAERLRALAEARGTTPEREAERATAQWADSAAPSRDFEQATRHVLQKNQELYRRLS